MQPFLGDGMLFEVTMKAPDAGQYQAYLSGALPDKEGKRPLSLVAWQGAFRVRSAVALCRRLREALQAMGFEMCGSGRGAVLSGHRSAPRMAEVAGLTIGCAVVTEDRVRLVIAPTATQEARVGATWRQAEIDILKATGRLPKAYVWRWREFAHSVCQWLHLLCAKWGADISEAEAPCYMEPAAVDALLAEYAEDVRLGVAWLSCPPGAALAQASKAEWQEIVSLVDQAIRQGHEPPVRIAVPYVVGHELVWRDPYSSQEYGRERVPMGSLSTSCGVGPVRVVQLVSVWLRQLQAERFAFGHQLYVTSQEWQDITGVTPVAQGSVRVG